MNSTVLQFRANIQIDYPQIIERGAVGELGRILIELVGSGRPLVLVTDHDVPELHVDVALRSLSRAGLSVSVLRFSPGERNKSTTSYQALIDQLHERRVHRRSVLLAFGGGVVCDLVGFVAATYMRGIDYVNVPTTLIGQLDASIGGKVGINHTRCKNLTGAFWHPRGVIIDPNLLDTLPDDEFRCGLAEAVKVAMINSPRLFELLEENSANLGRDLVDTVIVESVRSKLALLLMDPFEQSLRRPLNFGHTFAHAIEVQSDYTVKHGYAVSIGMCIAARVSESRGCMTKEDRARLFSLLRSLGLPTTTPPYDIEDMWQSLLDIRSIRGNHFHVVLPLGIGDVRISDDLLHEEFASAYTDLRNAI